MNPESPKSAREELEARITALLLGELSAEEAALLRKAIAKDTELSQLHNQLKNTIELVRETATSRSHESVGSTEALKLSNDRREKLLQSFKISRPKEFKPERSKAERREWAAVAAMAIGLLVVGSAVVAYYRIGAGSRGYQRTRILTAVGGSSSDRESLDLYVKEARNGLAGKERIQISGGISASSLRKTEPEYSSYSVIVTPAPAQSVELNTATPEPLSLAQSVRTEDVTTTPQGTGPATGPAAKPTAGVQGESASTITVAKNETSGSFQLPSAPPAASLPAFDFSEGTKVVQRPQSRQDASSAGVTTARNAGRIALPDSRDLNSDKGVAVAGESLPGLGNVNYLALDSSSHSSDDSVRFGNDPNRFGVVGSPQTPDPKSGEKGIGLVEGFGLGGLRTGKDQVVAGAPVDAATPTVKASGASAQKPQDLGLASVQDQLGERLDGARFDFAQRFQGVVRGDNPQDSDEDRVLRSGAQKSDDSPKSINSFFKGGSLLGPLPTAPTPPVMLSGDVEQKPRGFGSGAGGFGGANPTLTFNNASVSQSEAMQQFDVGGILVTNFTANLWSVPGEGEKKDKEVKNIQAHDQWLLQSPDLFADSIKGIADTPKKTESKDASGRRVVEGDLKKTMSPEVGNPQNTSQPIYVNGAPQSIRQLVSNPPGASAPQEQTAANKERVEIALPKAPGEGDREKPSAPAAVVLRETNYNPVKVEPAQEFASLSDGEQQLEEKKLESNPENSDVTRPKPATPAAVPQPEISATENPFSTFSLNVSDVSFKLAAASLEKGVMPDVASVRSEEFINAFDYRDPEPPPGTPISFHWERARYPFAHNRDMVRFSIKTAASGRQSGRPLNLVLLLDNSGSMERADRVRIIQQCLRVLSGQLQPYDRVSVVAFSRTARLWVDGLSGSEATNLVERVGGLAPQGGTNLEEAMNLAYTTALRHYLPNGVNRVVLLTDGAANLGDVDPESLKKKVEAHRLQGIALDCFGIGWEGYNDDLLEVLSRNGDGRYGFVNTPEAAATEFAGQLAGALKVAASDVKVQVEFNPRRVSSYRQIGYAKHQLKKEQFRDNTVDAAEIGAAEAGNALYVVQVDPRGEGPLATVRVRYKTPGTTQYHEHEWPVPYTGTAKLLEQSGPALRLATVASAFSEWLASNPYAAEVSLDQLLTYLAGVPETCQADPRPKKLEWMIRQAKSISGR